ncbi:MAG: TenA family protein [Legionella sp.]|uniref:TenA family protein n=1 Tax=Legionella sp. TaxID=459 RepID=UPI0039E5D100
MKNKLSIFKLAPGFIGTLRKTEPVEKQLKLIVKHQFNKELFDGTLNPIVFGDYLHDDYIYLHHYALALQKIEKSLKKTYPSLAELLYHLATDILDNEKNMQKEYDKYFTYSEASKPQAAITNYIHFINTHINSPLPVALCSILPCFMIYYQLGILGNQQKVENNPYQNWINTYSSPEFSQATHALIDVINELAQKTNAEVLEQMRNAFVQAVTLELQFFDEVVPELIPASVMELKKIA